MYGIFCWLESGVHSHQSAFIGRILYIHIWRILKTLGGVKVGHFRFLGYASE